MSFVIKYKPFSMIFYMHYLFFLKENLIIHISQKFSNSAPQLIYLVKKIYKLYEVLPDSLAAIYFIYQFFFSIFNYFLSSHDGLSLFI